jgi:hypothetical protein
MSPGTREERFASLRDGLRPLFTEPVRRVVLIRSDGMELAAGPPAHWVVTLVDGSEVDVWADAVTGLTEKTAHQEHIVFGVLLDVDVALQGQFEVTATSPARSRRVEVAVARFPRGCVQDVVTVG